MPVQANRQSLYVYSSLSENFSPDSLTPQPKVGPQKVEFLVPVSIGS